jgi:hypothetical protein
MHGAIPSLPQEKRNWTRWAGRAAGTRRSENHKNVRGKPPSPPKKRQLRRWESMHTIKHDLTETVWRCELN